MNPQTEQDLMNEQEWAVMAKEEMREFHDWIDRSKEQSNKHQDKEIGDEPGRA